MNKRNYLEWPPRQGGDDLDPMPYAPHLRETPYVGRSHSHTPLWTAIACLFGMMLPLWVVAIRIMEGRS